ncbi:hypothetical protein [Nonomuraea jabiensis]|uniref:alpha-L-rhamnosidase-related protein n=1 Tax=Nonomuraea jabiensis TaxID=882448 RepID=UPI003D75AAF6
MQGHAAQGTQERGPERLLAAGQAEDLTVVVGDDNYLGADSVLRSRHPQCAAARSTSERHEQYLWDAGSHLGEWLAPGEEVLDLDAHAQLDQGHIATAFYAYSADLAARIAEVLGKADEAKSYRALSDKVRAAWQAEYIGPDGRLIPDTQADHVRALAFDLVPAGLRLTSAAPSGRAGTGGGHAPGHRFPRDALSPARARRHRSPRPCLRTAAAGHRK